MKRDVHADDGPWWATLGLRNRNWPDPAECVFRHVTRTARALAKLYDAQLAPLGLTGGQFNILMTLHREGALKVGTLAFAIGVDPSTLPRLLRPLAEAGLVRTRPGKDRRERHQEITAAGRKALAEATPLWAAAQRQIVSQVGPAEWAGSRASLARLREAARQ